MSPRDAGLCGADSAGRHVSSDSRTVDSAHDGGQAARARRSMDSGTARLRREDQERTSTEQ